MLTIYRDEAGTVRTSSSLELPPGVIWMDLLDPTGEERSFVESHARIRVPSREALTWHLGYPMALAVIVLSGAVPLAWFKVRGWF